MAIDTDIFEDMFDDVFDILGTSISYGGTEIEADVVFNTEAEKRAGSALSDIVVEIKKTDVSSVSRSDEIVIGSKTYSDIVIFENREFSWLIGAYDQDVT